MKTIGISKQLDVGFRSCGAQWMESHDIFTVFKSDNKTKMLVMLGTQQKVALQGHASVTVQLIDRVKCSLEYYWRQQDLQLRYVKPVVRTVKK